MSIMVGRDEDGIPRIISDWAGMILYRVYYGDARNSAGKIPLWKLKAFIDGIDEAIIEMNPISRFLYTLDERICPDPSILAYRDVLKQRRMGKL